MRTAAILVALAVTSSAAATERARYLMGTTCAIAIGGSANAEGEIEGAFAEAKRVESMLSTWTADSELARLNRGEGEASPELRALLDKTLDYARRTNGAFNPRIKALVDAWKTREDGALPDAQTIAHAMRASAFEEGAFGKGYAIDRMLAAIDARDVLIDFGGQLGVRGEHRISIADPANRERPVIALTMRDGSLSTSSGSEKTFAVGGRQFSHLLDPRTGQALPPRGSVSVLAPEALTADILSTALYVMGETEGLRWADSHGVAAIFITPANQIRFSAAARAQARDLEVVSRNFMLKEN